MSQQLQIDWTKDVNAARGRSGGRIPRGLPWSGRPQIAKHRSAQAAQRASSTRAEKSLHYLALLEQAGARGLTDHEARRLMGERFVTSAAEGFPMSSIQSIRNGAGPLVVANVEEHGISPYGGKVTLWRLAKFATAPGVPGEPDSAVAPVEGPVLRSDGRTSDGSSGA